MRCARVDDDFVFGVYQPHTPLFECGVGTLNRFFFLEESERSEQKRAKRVTAQLLFI
jgi:hypothetical protein